MKTTVQLETPIEFGGGKITEIELREPTLDEMTELGVPAEEDLTKNVALFSKYIKRIGSIDPKAVGRMTVRDTLRVIVAIQPFFTVAGTPTSEE